MSSKVTSVFLTLLLGFTGGVVFYYLTMPLPWVLGSLMVIGGLSLWGQLSLRIPNKIRQSMLAVLGVLLGSGFKPGETGHIALWTVSLGIIPLMLLTQIAFVQTLLKVILKKENFATRFFGGAASGILEMTLMAREKGGDDRAVMVMHGLRVIMIVALVPLYFRVFEGYVPSQLNKFSGGLIDLSLIDLALLFGAGFIGYYAGAKTRLPAHAIMGPFMVSAIFHSLGLTSAQPPYVVIVLAQIVVGASLGTRFTGYSLGRIRKLFFSSVVVTVVLMAVATGFAFAIHNATGLPLYGLVLAFVPGGMVEMSLIALALNIDVGFVTTHAILRAFLVVMMAPALYPLLLKLRSMFNGK